MDECDCLFAEELDFSSFSAPEMECDFSYAEEMSMGLFADELDASTVPSYSNSKPSISTYQFQEEERKVSLLLDEIRKTLSAGGGGAGSGDQVYVYEPDQLSETDYIPTPALGPDVVYSGGEVNFATSRSKSQVKAEMEALKALLQANFLDEDDYAIRFRELEELFREAPSDPQPPQAASTSHAGGKKDDRKNRNRNVRVFVSSTFVDMKDEREVLLKQVFPQLQKFCNDRGVFLTCVDLRWGITTEQSTTGDTINICLREVDNCRPYFVCMLGSRYGWAQDKDKKTDVLLDKTFKKAALQYPWVGDYNDRSITELEVRHAVLNTGTEETARNSLFYFKNTKEPASSPKLTQLKEEIVEEGLPVLNYDSPNEIGQHVLEALKEKLDKQFPLQEKPHPLERERMAHSAFQDTRARVYIGRQDYFDRINDFVAFGNKPVVVIGESGSGKSALVANWVHRHEVNYPERLVVAHYIGSTSSSSELSSLLRRLLFELQNHFGLHHKEIPSDPSEMSRVLGEWLMDANERGGFTLVLDALNQLSGNDNAHSLEWLPSQFPPKIQVVVSTLPGRCLDVLSNRKWNMIRVEPLGEDERQLFVEQYMAQYAKTLTAIQVRSLVAAKQCANPLFLKTLLEELRVFGSFEELNDRIAYYLQADSPPALFQKVFERLEKDYESKRADVVSEVLTALWTSRKGLSELELSELLDIPQALLSPLLIALENCLVSQAGNLTFFHDYMRQAVYDRYVDASGAGQSKGTFFRDRLIQYFNRPAAPHDRRCEEVPHHLLLNQQWHELHKFIASPANFNYLVKGNNKMDLYKYWRETTHQRQPVESLLVSNMTRFSSSSATPTPSRTSRDSTSTTSEKTIRQLLRAGKFLQELACFNSAESLYLLAQSLAAGRGGVASTSSSSLTMAKIYSILGNLFQETGKYAKATPLLEQALEIMGKSSDANPAEMTETKRQLGVLFRKQGKYPMAEEHLKNALKTGKGLFGEVHEGVADTYNELGRLKQTMGQYNEAEVFFIKAMQLRESVFGKRHPKVAQSLKDLGDLYILASRFDEGYSLLEKALELYVETFGEHHPAPAETIQSMGSARQQQGRYKEAQEFYEKALAIQRATLGSMHPDVALTLNDYGGLYLRQSIFDRAESIYLEAENIRRQVLGEDHMDYAGCLANLGSLNQKKQNFSKAVEYLERSISILQNIYEDQHMDIATACLNLAGVYQQMGQFRDALPLYSRALSILTSLLGNKHAHVAIIINDLAILYFNLQEYKKAEETYITAVAAYQAIYGHVHPGVGQVLYNMASFYQKTGEGAKALDCFRQSVRVFEACLGSHDPKTERSRREVEALSSESFQLDSLQL